MHLQIAMGICRKVLRTMHRRRQILKNLPAPSFFTHLGFSLSREGSTGKCQSKVIPILTQRISCLKEGSSQSIARRECTRYYWCSKELKRMYEEDCPSKSILSRHPFRPERTWLWCQYNSGSRITSASFNIFNLFVCNNDTEQKRSLRHSLRDFNHKSLHQEKERSALSRHASNSTKGSNTEKV